MVFSINTSHIIQRYLSRAHARFNFEWIVNEFTRSEISPFDFHHELCCFLILLLSWDSVTLSYNPIHAFIFRRSHECTMSTIWGKQNAKAMILWHTNAQNTNNRFFRRHKLITNWNFISIICFYKRIQYDTNFMNRQTQHSLNRGSFALFQFKLTGKPISFASISFSSFFFK